MVPRMNPTVWMLRRAPTAAVAAMWFENAPPNVAYRGTSVIRNSVPLRTLQ